ncbi:CTP synthase [Candidatus Woesearchaeota archaeon]|nr:MAG: CTP synthase [Candidatus Woesearchaeota archaeon]
MKRDNVLENLASKSTEHEFYTPKPKGYRPGRTKYVIVFGTVMSGLGKGIFSSSLGKLLQDQGLKVAPVKFDGYLNVDAGTLNPYRHGEVFVLDDGLECDMDLGNYERFLDQDLSEKNYMTGGRIFTSVLGKERKGKYLGRDVQFIPHVTGEIKGFLRNLAVHSKADVVLVEVGGTVGDVENSYFIEAMRELAYEEGQGNVCFVALTYILEPGFLGEQKSKAAQIGIRDLMARGIQPHIVACRSTNPITEKVREKISIYSNVPLDRVVGLHDLKSIYEIPQLVKEDGIDKEVIEILGIKSRVKPKKGMPSVRKWNAFLDKLHSPKGKVVIGITGKYTSLRDSYASVLNAIEHASVNNSVKAEIKWIETTEIEKGKIKVEDALKDVDGIIVPGGFGKRGIEGKIECIRYARENNIPYLGLCLGFQMAVIEYARNVAGLKDANSTEMKKNPKHPVICLLPEQMKIESLGGNMRLGGHDVLIKKGTLAHKLYKKEKARERFRHRYECNPEYVETLEKAGMVFSGTNPRKDIMQILELPQSRHRFFIGSQFHPEFTSRPLRPNPLFFGFIKAAVETSRERKNKE